jgi:hypothetical protein
MAYFKTKNYKMRKLIILLVFTLTAAFAYSQDTVSIPVLEPIADTVQAPADNGTLVKIDEVVDKLGEITGVDTLASIDEAYEAVQSKIAEAKALEGSPWYAWLSYVISLLALAFGAWKLFFAKQNK